VEIKKEVSFRDSKIDELPECFFNISGFIDIRKIRMDLNSSNQRLK